MRPLLWLMGAVVPIFGKYVLIRFWTVGFKKREGIVINRVTPLESTTVSFATSVGVIITNMSLGTAGLRVSSVNSEKSPVQNVGCGSELEVTLTGETFQFRS